MCAQKINEHQKSDLQEILQHSIFNTEGALEEQFESLSQYKSGTRIVIYNLKQTSDGLCELDFQSKPDDIIYSESNMRDMPAEERVVRDYTPEYWRSLRVGWLVILYVF